MAVLMLVSAVSAIGCEDGWKIRRERPSPPPIKMPEPPTRSPTAVKSTTQPAPAAAGTTHTTVMATVNGEPIYMQQLTEPLVEIYGLRTAEMLIASKLVAQEASRQKVVVTDEDVKAEGDRMLEGMFEEDLTAEQRERMLTQILHSRGMTPQLWRRTLVLNATLRKMAAPRVKITEPMLRQQFLAEYGKKVQIAHIQLPSLGEAEKILKLLKQGGDFAELAKRYSTNATTARNDGVLPPFTRDDARVPQAMRDAAFALEAGQVSEIVQAGNEYQVVKLLKRITPPDAKYAEVKDKLRESLRAKLIKRVQTEILTRLRRAAAVEYVDPVLKKARQQALTGGP